MPIYYQVTEIPGPSPEFWCSPSAINAGGDVVGLAQPLQPLGTAMCMYSAGVTHFLLPGVFGLPYSLNQGDDVVGMSGDSDMPLAFFIADGASTMTNLHPFLPANATGGSQATQINDAREISGGYWAGSDGGFVYQLNNQHLIDLTALAISESSAVRSIRCWLTLPRSTPR